MNLDALSAGPDADPPAAPPDWTMDIELDSLGAGYVGVVRRAGIVMCRILLAGSEGNTAAVRTALAVRARTWIADYLARPHSGDTDFQALND